MDQEKALLLNTEIAAVVTAMRQNSKWAVIPRYTDEDIGDDLLLEKFKALRRKVFRWTDWSEVDALEYLTPFLEVVRSAETSGPITAMALSSINKLISHELIGSSAGSSHGLALAMHNTAEAVTHCKFESTDHASDEVVLSKILQVLLECLKCPTGKYLSDSDVCNIFQACFRIGHGHPPGKEGELLTQMSRSILSEMVSVIFGRLSEMQEPSASAEHDPAFDAHAIRPVSTGDLSSMVAATSTPPEGSKRQTGEEAAADAPGGSGDSTADSSGSTEDVQDMAYPRPSREGSIAATAAAAAAEEEAAAEAAAASAAPPGAATQPAESGEGSPAEDGVPEASKVSEAETIRSIISLSKSEASLLPPEPSASPTQSPRVWCGYGIGCATEVLGFLVSLVGAQGQEADEIRVFGLELINVALTSGRYSFIEHEGLMDILQTDLFQAMHKAARSSNLAALSGSCSVALSLYVYLGKRMILQLEAYIEHVLLRIADGKGCTYEQQEAALEGILDLCHQAAFVRDLYANLDCRIERQNVFEDICALLSKTAFPVNCPLRSVHLISLESLLAVLKTLSSQPGIEVDEEEGGSPDTSSTAYADIWSSLVDGKEPLIDNVGSSSKSSDYAWVRSVQGEKHLKGRLNIAADHFNRDPKKGFQFLQAIKLLPNPLDAKAVACFLRACPGLHKKAIGTLLGELHFKNSLKDNFYLDVLDHFTKSFDFTGMKFDEALRLYLEAFQLPGEAQKIDRIVNSFGTRFYEQSEGLLRNSDAAYVLGYSVIMLNTDAHNDQVKMKMTLEQFVKNNRGINDGENLPMDFQQDLYYSIVKNAIKLNDNNSGSGSSAGGARWAELRRASMLPRGQLSRRGPGAELLDRDMFCLIWGPTVAAISVVLDHADDPAVMKQALDGLALAARIAAQHNVDEVMDSLVVSLGKFTNVLNPNIAKPVVAFGDDLKARQAAETVFMLANRYGDCLRAGWRNVLDAVVRIHKLGLLPHSVFLMEGEDKEAGIRRIPSANIRQPKQGQSSNMLGIKWTGFIISFDDSNSNSTPTQSEVEAEQRAVQCIEACRIDEIFCDSKFLRAESLVELVRSIIWASGISGAALSQDPGHQINMSEDDIDTAEVCLELLIGITIRNRDRIELLWPSVHAHLETIIRNATQLATTLVERAVLGLLRVCQRLLPYKEDISDELLRSLHLIFRLDPKVAEDLAEVITSEVLGLVKSSAAYIRSEWGWNTVCALLKAASHHPAAFPMAFEALGVLVQEGHLMKQNFLPCLETALTFIDNSQKQAAPSHTKKVLDLLESMNAWLVSSAERDPQEHESYASMWLSLIQALCKPVLNEPDPNLRNHAVVVLHRVVSPELTEGLNLPAETWGVVFQEMLLPLVSKLAAVLHSTKGRGAPEIDRTLRLAVNMLSKTLLQCLGVLRTLPSFPEIWVGTLTALQECTRNHSEELSEAVPENLKNMLRYMSHQRVLVPEWKDAAGASLWEVTWKKSQSISTGLTPQVLEGAAA